MHLTLTWWLPPEGGMLGVKAPGTGAAGGAAGAADIAGVKLVCGIGAACGATTTVNIGCKKRCGGVNAASKLQPRGSVWEDLVVESGRGRRGTTDSSKHPLALPALLHKAGQGERSGLATHRAPGGGGAAVAAHVMDLSTGVPDGLEGVWGGSTPNHQPGQRASLYVTSVRLCSSGTTGIRHGWQPAKRQQH